MHLPLRRTLPLIAIVVVGASTAAAAGAKHHPGTLDKTFSANGVARVDLVPGKCKKCGGTIAEAVAVDPRGRIVAKALIRRSTGFKAYLVRYRPNGSLDSSFSGDGIVRLGFPAFGDFAIDSEGRVLVLDGERLKRLQVDGSFDSSLGGDGGIQLPFGSAFAVDSEDRIVVAGLDYGGFFSGVTVARYLADGSPDRSFDDSARVELSDRLDSKPPSGVTVGPDGSIFVSSGGEDTENDGDDGVPGLVKFLPDGGVDESFGDGGSIIAGSGGHSEEYGRVAVDSRGRILAGTDGFIDRFRPNGDVDDSFSLDGRVRAIGGSSVAVDDRDRVIAAGSGDGLVRYRPNGKPSRSFGKQGFATPGYLRSAALGLDSRGRIVTSGAIPHHGYYSDETHLLVERYFGG